MNRTLAMILALLLFLLGLTVLLYPTVHGAALEHEAATTAEQFMAARPTAPPAEDMPQASPTPMPYEELHQAMTEYNAALFAAKQEGLSDPWAYEAESIDLASYGVEDGVIGVLSIPALELEMPVYLGATADHMSMGAAHLSQTSLPLGGENTNCVIAGHRGWNGAAYFQFLDQLQVGDEVTLTNLWETLTYTVSEIRVIEPYEVDQILIQPGRELLTLLTCHPYASGGKYRYVVYCERDNRT